MNNVSFFFLLLGATAIGFATLVVLKILDLLKAPARQRLFVLKTSVLITAAAPLLFVLLRNFARHTFVIPVSGIDVGFSHVESSNGTFIGLHLHWSYYGMYAYLAGVLLMVSHLLLSYLRARTQLAGSWPDIIQGQLIYRNRCIESPKVFGFPIAKIYFPADAEARWSARDIQLSLAHEQVHLLRGDAFWKILSLINRALFFFAPWMYRLHRRLELEIEISCDERTRVAMNASEKEYGHLLLSMAVARPQNLMFTNVTDSTLKRRIIAMKSRTIQRPLTIVAASIFLFLAGGAAIATTSGLSEKKTIFTISTQIFVDGKLIAGPRIMTLAGEEASITQRLGRDSQLNLAVIARDVSGPSESNRIGMNFEVHIQDGEEMIHSTPRLVVVPNEPARLSVKPESGRELEIAVIATRQ